MTYPAERLAKKRARYPLIRAEYAVELSTRGSRTLREVQAVIAARYHLSPERIRQIVTAPEAVIAARFVLTPEGINQIVAPAPSEVTA